MNIVKINHESPILTERYAPKSKKYIIGCDKEVNEIDSWITKFNKNRKDFHERKSKKKTTSKRRKKSTKKELNNNVEVENSIDIEKDISLSNRKNPNLCSCLIVTGDHGCGKSSIVKAILNGKKYIIKQINFTKTLNVKRIDDFVNNLMFSKNVYGDKERKVAILVDEIESVSTPKEKKIILSLIEKNNDTWALPIIFISNRNHKKMINVVKKESYIVNIPSPSTKELTKLLSYIALREKMKFQDESILIDLVKNSQNDYRRLIISLQELKRNYGNQKITRDLLNQYLMYSDTKDVDATIHENTNKLFSKYDGISGALKIFESDKINMPLMSQQNHFMTLTKYIENKDDTIDISSRITESISNGDIVDNYIYSEQNWELQPVHGFYTCVVPSYFINNNIDTSKLVEDSSKLVYNHEKKHHESVYKTDYPKDLNRTSTKKINYKNVKFANNYFSGMEIDDYIYCIKIVKNLLLEDRLDECKKILESYGATNDAIRKLLSIDKINGTKKDIPKDMEKKIKIVSYDPPNKAKIYNENTLNKNKDGNENKIIAKNKLKGIKNIKNKMKVKKK
jgi:hypothetical protein